VKPPYLHDGAVFPDVLGVCIPGGDDIAQDIDGLSLCLKLGPDHLNFPLQICSLCDQRDILCRLRRVLYRGRFILGRQT
jgi:hypothetical protein